MAVKLNNWNYRNLELIYGGSYFVQAKCFVRLDASQKAVWRVSSLKLDDYIGATSYGEFDIKSSTGFSKWAKKGSIRLSSTVLHAELSNGSGWTPASVDLTLLLANCDGDLKYTGKSESICYSAYLMTLDLSTMYQPTLKGLCLRKDGRLYPAGINLDTYYKNVHGAFESVAPGELGRFSRTAEDLKLEISEAQGVRLQARLKYGSVWHPAQVDLSISIVNKGEGFVYERHDGPFDRDGALTKYFEGFPLVGFIVAAVHSITGNDDWATRAIALCLNSSLVLAGNTFGAMIGGPIGAVIGAGIGTVAGITAETILRKGITDLKLRSAFEEATIGRYIYETSRNMLSAGAVAAFSKYILSAPGPKLTKLQKEVEDVLHFTTENYVLDTLNIQLADVVVKGEASEYLKKWIETEKKVEDMSDVSNETVLATFPE